MAKSSLKVESDPIGAAASRIDTAADNANSTTARALGSAESLGSTVFGVLVDDVVGALRNQLPNDISLLVKSYAKGLLALSNAAAATDHALAAKAKTGAPKVATEAEAGVVITGIALAGGNVQGGSVTLQGSGVLLQGSSPNLQGSGAGSRRSSPAPATSASGSGQAAFEGPGAFTNASLVATAKTYPVGSHGGQCRAFISNVVSEATGGKVDLQAYANPQHDYFTALEQNGTRIGDVSQLRPGDIVQIGEFESDPHLHTFMIEGVPYQTPDGSWRVHVIDSNSDLHETVQEYDRPITLSDDERAYRLGQV